MANTFKNKLVGSIGTGATDVYTAGSGVTATAIGLTVANRTSSNITVDVLVVDTSASVTNYLVKTAPVLVGGSLVAIGGNQKLVLEVGDKIQVLSSASSSADAILSVLEIT